MTDLIPIAGEIAAPPQPQREAQKPGRIKGLIETIVAPSETATYLVFPRRPQIPEGVHLATLGGDRLSREEQIKALNILRNNDPLYDRLNEWIGKHSVRALENKDSRATPIAGIRVLQMTPSDAERLRSRIPDFMVAPDRPVRIVRPFRVALSNGVSSEGATPWHLDAVGVPDARERGLTGHGVTVAVLDTGIDASHPELPGKVKRVVPEPAPAGPLHPHGTHVAGLICGANVGVAPGATLLDIVSFPQGEGMESEFIWGLYEAAADPEVQIANLSAGLPGYVPAMEQAVADLVATGVLPVVAAGNDGRNRSRSPGNYRDVLSVGATTRAGRVAAFSASGTILASSHHRPVPDLVAPGAAILSCVPQGQGKVRWDAEGDFDVWNGTSMAAPVVSGVAALVREAEPKIGLLDLIDRILSACEHLNDAPDRMGAGLVHAGSAVCT